MFDMACTKKMKSYLDFASTTKFEVDQSCHTALVATCEQTLYQVCRFVQRTLVTTGQKRTLALRAGLYNENYVPNPVCLYFSKN
ncbi:unnamed protein product, partial [Amoebophrya sp. A120]|eukprot:GSA120T00007680001.1